MRPLRFLFCFLVSCSAIAQTSYTTSVVNMTVAGANGASYENAAMNNAGQIASTLVYSGCSDNYYRAAAFDQNAALTAVYGTLAPDPVNNSGVNGCPSWPFSQPAAINSSGRIVGSADAPDPVNGLRQVAALFENGATTDLNTLVTGGATNLSLTSAASINDNGDIVGMLGTQGVSGFLLSAGKAIDLGSFSPGMINNKGQIMGRSTTNNELMIYDSGSFIALGVVPYWTNLPRSVVMNNLGHVAGLLETDPNVGSSSGKAFFWDGTTLRIIGNADVGSGIALNNNDQIAYDDLQDNTWIWSPSSVPLELNPMLSFSGSNWVLPIAMNDSGRLLLQVPGYGGGSNYILATPTAVVTAQSTVPVQVASGGISLQFPTVSGSGTTTVTRVAPSTIGSIPSGFTAVGQAYVIDSTASYTAPVTLTFTAPGPLSQTDFQSLQVTHYINGQVDPSCCAVQSRDYTTLTIQVLTNSFSPFLLVRRTPPTISGASDIHTAATSAAGAAVSYTVTAAAATGGAASVSCLPASGSTFSLGRTNVACTATDSQGLSSQAHFKVAVADTTPPVLQLPPSPIVVSAADSTGAVVNYNVSATDDIDGVLNGAYINCNPASGNLFPIGATTVNCTATDHSGNVSAGSFVVLVGGPADVAMVVVPSSAPVVHHTVQYGIGIANRGPATAYGTTFTASLPMGVSLQSATGATCSSTKSSVTCTIGTMQYKSGTLFALKLNVNVVGRATLTSNMNVQAANPDPNQNNNSVAVQIKTSH